MSTAMENKQWLLVITQKQLGSLFKNLGRSSAKVGKQLATKVIKNTGRTLQLEQKLTM